MRIAVLSDIHANLAALEAVRADLPQVDEIWVLGDMVGYGPQPNEVIATLQEMGARSVLGNHDGAAIETVDANWFNPDARAAIEWTRGILDDNARTYIGLLPQVRTVSELTAVHGSPRDPIWEYIVSEGIAAANLESFGTRLCLFGHTHLPAIFSERDGVVEGALGQPGSRVDLDGGRALVNPGSVGQPRDGVPDAAYAILQVPDDGTGAWSVEFRRVPYEIEVTQRLMRERNLPVRLVERLTYGR